ncbi:5'-methylthioadenosine/S-adenosylhomocysteine nucleosidase family protein [Dyadobacter sp. 22481]|uniref:5'-methylthioadenosine/S-adenosylhomocysteine nucleosidase family protein n=1 Tax=Dyadobacter sp. 22481 TaxID=3453926 RepID=UPI003F86BA8A
MDTIDLESSKVVILTALREEYDAVREQLEDLEEVEENSSIYEQGIFKVGGEPVAKVVIRECGPRNETAALEVERAIGKFSPVMVFFVGIAGSRKPSDFKVGDVIVGEKIYFYEGGKELKDSFRARPEAHKSSYKIIEQAKSVRRSPDWKLLFKGNENIDNVKADKGIIASGAKVIEHVDSHQGTIIATHYNDAHAVEMEGFGFSDAMFNREGGEAYAVIRGISDVLQEGSPDLAAKVSIDTELIKQDRRPEETKIFASRTAAAFTFQLIYKIVIAKKKSLKLDSHL